MKLLVVFNLLMCFVYSSISEEYGFEKIIGIVEKTYDSVVDYSCIVYKKEFVEGEYFERKNIFFKYKKNNFYYMKWNEGDDRGMEAIFAGKKYNNKIRVHLGGAMKFVDLDIDPLGDLAMDENRHSIFESDFGYIIKLLKKNYHIAQKLNINPFHFIGKRAFDKKSVQLYEFVFPQNKGFYANKIHLYICSKLNLPVKLVVYDWDQKLVENYEFSDVKVNNGLNEYDFDVENPDYNF